ncbi:MAG TPA: hypothetical protein VMM56_12445 [Planctomycetaceae bacterium]|nr:hypothetical protein [Planctomycetaceae bacterium]
MESLFLWCAVIGGSIFALQFVMLLIGLEGGHDLDVSAPELDVPDVDVPDVDVPDVDGVDDVSHVSLKDADLDLDHHPDSFAHSDGWFVGIITFRSLVAAVAVFGLTGLGATKHLPPEKAIAVASLAGFGMLYLVGWGFKQLYQLQADGTVKMQDTVGCTGTVYLTILGQHQGAGKVTVKVAERTMEYRAMTAGETLKTGAPVVVVKVISEDTLEVESQLPVETVTSGTQQNL